MRGSDGGLTNFGERCRTLEKRMDSDDPAKGWARGSTGGEAVSTETGAATTTSCDAELTSTASTSSEKRIPPRFAGGSVTLLTGGIVLRCARAKSGALPCPMGVALGVTFDVALTGDVKLLEPVPRV